MCYYPYNENSPFRQIYSDTIFIIVPLIIHFFHHVVVGTDKLFRCIKNKKHKKVFLTVCVAKNCIFLSNILSEGRHFLEIWLTRPLLCSLPYSVAFDVTTWSWCFQVASSGFCRGMGPCQVACSLVVHIKPLCFSALNGFFFR